MDLVDYYVTYILGLSSNSVHLNFKIPVVKAPILVSKLQGLRFYTFKSPRSCSIRFITYKLKNAFLFIEFPYIAHPLCITCI